MELKQRYEAQQNALMVLEQRVRQVEEAPATPAPKRLTKSPAESPNSGQKVATGAPGTTGSSYGQSLKDDSEPAQSVSNLYDEASGFFGGGKFSVENRPDLHALRYPCADAQRLPGTGLDFSRQHQPGPYQGWTTGHWT